MKSVGVRELKERLSHYIRAVRRGEIIEVTVRGKPVARLVPAYPDGETALEPKLEERMWELVTEGFLTWSGNRPQIPQPVAVNHGPGLLSDMVREDRELWEAARRTGLETWPEE